MSEFAKLLNSPLPSAMQKEEVLTEGCMEGCGQECGTGCAPVAGPADMTQPAVVAEDDDDVDLDDIDDAEDEFDPDDLSDEELADLDAELSNNVTNGAVAALGGDNGEVKLSPEEEMEADDMMKVAATTLLVKDELNAQERAEFLQNEAEVNTAINEGFMTESDINILAAEAGLMTESKYTNKMIIKLNAEAKKKQLYALAVNVSAAAHHDPDYIKYKKVMKLKKLYRMKLERKYHSEAVKRARVYYNRLRNSKSNTLSKIAK